jgi:hypothetical protein
MPENMQDQALEQDEAGKAARQPLPPAAERALAEAAERRKPAAAPAPKEIGGRPGPDPARFGDWEAKGIAHDF